MCSVHHVLLAFWDEVIVMLVKDRVGQDGTGLRVHVGGFGDRICGLE